ncbi:methyl-accepting chemotaxis protein [Lachnospiraceae bacterium KM106-2]|nr:methyl-accepting chemotaxis protein [Lachnospiraceae bacterium KM106-2]
MENVHKRNLIIIWGCILALATTTIGGYGLCPVAYKGIATLVVTGIICSIIYKLSIDDTKKALTLVLLPSYAILIYSWIVGGNSTAFEATYVTLGMAAGYFNRKIIKLFTIPFIIVTSIVSLLDYKILSDFSLIGAVTRIIIFTATSILIYIGTVYGEEKIKQVRETLQTIDANRDLAHKVSNNLNDQVQHSLDAVNNVTEQSNMITESTEQISHVVEENSNAFLSVSKKIKTTLDQVNQNYENASKLEQSFHSVNDAVTNGNEKAATVKTSMNQMAGQVGSAKEATVALLDQMDNIQNILSEITSIAEQTNLLSLNASIEAARAGEQGQGFAVVANEIRSLSEGSKNAADHIQEILTSLASLTQDVTDKISAGANAAVQSEDDITELLGVLHMIDSSTSEATKVVSNEFKIIESIRDQYNDINTEVESVAATSEENTAMIITINESVLAQTEAIHKLSESIKEMKESSDKLSESI